ARTIARQLWQSLRDRPFSGAVAGRFARGCNLADETGRVIALTTPAIGNGPFFIVLDTAADLFETLELQHPARVDADQIAIGHWHIPLCAARAWDATLPGGERALGLTPALAAILRPYTDWPQPAADTPASRSAARLLAQGARTLMDALEQRTDLAEAAQA